MVNPRAGVLLCRSHAAPKESRMKFVAKACFTFLAVLIVGECIVMAISF